MFYAQAGITYRWSSGVSTENRTILSILCECLSWKLVEGLEDFVFRQTRSDLLGFIRIFIFVFLALSMGRKELGEDNSLTVLSDLFIARTRNQLQILAGEDGPEWTIVMGMLRKSKRLFVSREMANQSPDMTRDCLPNFLDRRYPIDFPSVYNRYRAFTFITELCGLSYDYKTDSILSSGSELLCQSIDTQDVLCVHRHLRNRQVNDPRSS